MPLTREFSIYPNVKKISRFSKFLLCLSLSLGVLRGLAHSQCTALVAGAGVAAAPTLVTPINAGASYVTGTATTGNLVVICVNGSPTVPPTTATVLSDHTFKAKIDTPLVAGQVVTAQQYSAAGAPVYSALSAPAPVVDTCLETLQSGECQFRVEVDTSAAIGNGSQTNTGTTPNIMVTLDYQWHPPLSASAKRANGGKLADFAVHLKGRTGYTQSFAASSVQPASTNGGTAPPCPSNSKSPSSSNCMLAIPKPAFIAEIGGSFGGTTGIDSSGFYGEFGVSGRGSFQYLIPTNQIVQNNGVSYIDLNSTNPHNAVGFYEVTGYADVAQHDHALSSGKAENSSPLLVIEGGYQNNRGLQQLLPASPQSSTRNRYVGRFSFNYEVNKTNHSKVSVGMEYSGGIDGGPHVVQIFIGGNLNPAKLFGKNGQ
jgi:hypothetical protein